MADEYTETGHRARMRGRAELPPRSPSTPLKRVADQLQTVLPDGWRIEVTDTPGHDRGPRSTLRVLRPTGPTH